MYNIPNLIVGGGSVVVLVLEVDEVDDVEVKSSSPSVIT